ncbi:hypothetical protein NEOKW01_1627 [Nematocida sp. AWRm80]|nr:hypothetical protein NEOKW01_1627 [Nematocida sp. AWRm80]
MSEEYSSESNGGSLEDVSTSGSCTAESLSDISSDNAQLFNVLTGTPDGDSDSIELLIKQIKILDKNSMTEDKKQIIFNGLKTWVATEEDSWIVSFLSLVSLEDILPVMHKRTRKEVQSLPNKPEYILISSRFINVPEEAVCDMYTALPETLKDLETEKILFLSLEAPMDREEAEIKKAFPKMNLSKRNKLFPEYTEEIFLSIDEPTHAFMHGLNIPQLFLKGYLLDKPSLYKYISQMGAYYHEE